MIEVDASAIIVAAITAFVSIMGIVLAEIFGWRKTLNKMKHFEDLIGVDKNRSCLSQQHENMESVITNQNKEIKAVLDCELKSANSKLSHLYAKMKSEEETAKVQKTVLAANEKKMDETVDNMKYILDMYREQTYKVADLNAELKKLKQENADLKNKLNRISKQTEQKKGA